MDLGVGIAPVAPVAPVLHPRHKTRKNGVKPCFSSFLLVEMAVMGFFQEGKKGSSLHATGHFYGGVAKPVQPVQPVPFSTFWGDIATIQPEVW